MGVALGVVLGAMMQLVISSLGLIGVGFDYEAKIKWKNKGFRRVLGLLPPRSLDQGIDYFNSIVEINLASRMGEGVTRAYQQASTMSLMPVNLIGVAISNAAFPRMSERLAQGKLDLFRQELRSVLRWIIWLALPVATITFFARGYIVAFIKNGGDALIASILGALVVSIFFRTIYHIMARTFYAQQDTKTPLYISLGTISLNIALAVLFTQAWDMGVYGLAWAQSIVSAVEVFILFTILRFRTKGIFNRELGRAISKMVVAAVGTGFVTYVVVQLFQLQSRDMSFMSTFPKFFGITIISFAAYVFFCRLLRLREGAAITHRIKQLLYGRGQ